MSNSNLNTSMRIGIWAALVILGMQIQCAASDLRTAINNVAYSCHK